MTMNTTVAMTKTMTITVSTTVTLNMTMNMSMTLTMTVTVAVTMTISIGITIVMTINIPSSPGPPPPPPPSLPPSFLWPARVDLLVRAHVSPNFFLLGLLFQSIDLMWPKGVGDVILVLDERDQVVHHMLPHWVKVRGGSTGRRSWKGFRAG